MCSNCHLLIHFDPERAMTVQQRARAIETASDSSDLTDLSKFMTPPPSPLPTQESPTPNLSPSTQRDNEFLEKMFGPDAPGIVKPDEDK